MALNTQSLQSGLFAGKPALGSAFGPNLGKQPAQTAPPGSGGVDAIQAREAASPSLPTNNLLPYGVTQAPGTQGAQGGATVPLPAHIVAGFAPDMGLGKSGTPDTATWGVQQTWPQYVDNKNTEKPPATTQQSARSLGYQPYVIGGVVMSDVSALGGGGTLFKGPDGRIYNEAGMPFSGGDHYGTSYSNGMPITQQAATQPPTQPPSTQPPGDLVTPGTTPVNQPPSIPITPGFNIQDLFAALTQQGIAAQPSATDVTRRSGQDITDLENLLYQMIGNQSGMPDISVPNVPTITPEQQQLFSAIMQSAQQGLQPLTDEQKNDYLASDTLATRRAFEEERLNLDEVLQSRGLLTSGESISENARLMRGLDENLKASESKLASMDLLQRQPQNLALAGEIAQLSQTLQNTPFEQGIKRAQLTADIAAKKNILQQQTIQNVERYTEDLNRRRNEELATQMGLDLRQEDLAKYYGSQGVIDDPALLFEDYLGTTGAVDEAGMEENIASGVTPAGLELTATQDQNGNFMYTVPGYPALSTPAAKTQASQIGYEIQDLNAQIQQLSANPTTAEQHFLGQAPSTVEYSNLLKTFKEEQVIQLYRNQAGPQSIMDGSVDQALTLMQDGFNAVDAIVESQARGEPYGYSSADFNGDAAMIEQFNRASYDATMNTLRDAAKWAMLARYERANRNSGA